MIPLTGADLRYVAHWLSAQAAHELHAQLADTLPWTQHRVRLFGRELPSPRLSAWIGDADASYRYSGVRHVPLPWTAELTGLRARLQIELGLAFNSVLVNRYRDGQDSMGWHADDEPELGPAPAIASISLGETRTLHFRARRGDARLALALEHGSLLLMLGATQQNYLHAIHKSRKALGERINLTFRQIGADTLSSTVQRQRA